jgi:hypothetical protein
MEVGEACGGALWDPVHSSSSSTRLPAACLGTARGSTEGPRSTAVRCGEMLGAVEGLSAIICRMPVPY